MDLRTRATGGSSDTLRSASSSRGGGMQKERSRAGWRSVVLAAALLGVAEVAAAQEVDFARNGGYLAIGGTYAVDNSRIKEFTENSVGINAKLGLRFAPNIAVEAQFEHVSGFDVAVSGTALGAVEPWALTANAKGILLTGRIQPYLVAGMGMVRAKLADSSGTLGTLGLPSTRHISGFAMRLGGGVDVYTTEHHRRHPRDQLCDSHGRRRRPRLHQRRIRRAVSFLGPAQAFQRVVSTNLVDRNGIDREFGPFRASAAPSLTPRDTPGDRRAGRGAGGTGAGGGPCRRSGGGGPGSGWRRTRSARTPGSGGAHGPGWRRVR